jgi:3-isopropylmalate/(R)-2-methylmalate dehydratase small subunit
MAAVGRDIEKLGDKIEKKAEQELMQKFSLFNGMVAPLDRANVDTDQIIPKQFLKSIRRTGFGANLFDAWRYLDEGQPDKANENRPLNRDFVLNQPRFKGATILLARKNFGCGSSREHAPWALAEYGFRALIAPSYADIFFSNCCKNGLLPIALTEAEVDGLFHEVAAFPGFRLVVDLEKQTVATVDGGKIMHFEIDPFRKYCLMNGLDEVGLSLRHADKIRAFEEIRKAGEPWLFD